MQTARHYRRSAVCRAPRKRSFLVSMVKPAPSIPLVGAEHSRLCRANINDLCDGSGSGNNSGAGNGGGMHPNGGAPGGGGAGSPLYAAALVAAVAFSVLAPATSAQAAPGGADSPPSGYFAVSGFSRSARKNPRQLKDAIPYGVVELSGKERRMVAGGLEQLNTRETVRV